MCTATHNATHNKCAATHKSESQTMRKFSSLFSARLFSFTLELLPSFPPSLLHSFLQYLPLISARLYHRFRDRIIHGLFTNHHKYILATLRRDLLICRFLCLSTLLTSRTLSSRHHRITARVQRLFLNYPVPAPYHPTSTMSANSGAPTHMSPYREFDTKRMVIA